MRGGWDGNVFWDKYDVPYSSVVNFMWGEEANRGTSQTDFSFVMSQLMGIETREGEWMDRSQRASQTKVICLFVFLAFLGDAVDLRCFFSD